MSLKQNHVEKDGIQNIKIFSENGGSLSESR